MANITSTETATGIATIIAAENTIPALVQAVVQYYRGLAGD